MRASASFPAAAGSWTVHVHVFTCTFTICTRVPNLAVTTHIHSYKNQFNLFFIKLNVTRKCGSRIWSRGAQLLSPKVADIVKQSRTSEASKVWLGSRACLRTLEAFGFLMLKYVFSHILETLFL